MHRTNLSILYRLTRITSLVLAGLLVFIALGTFQVEAQSFSFFGGGLSGENVDNPTSLQFGPDGRLYVSAQNGNIYAYTIQRNGTANYAVTATELINDVKGIPNYNDDGTPYTSGQNSANRQITGIYVTGTLTNPVLYVSSSDARIGAGGGGGDLNLDTNSGIVSRLTWTGSDWDMVHIVRGLPRSEENHSVNGMQLFQTQGQKVLYLAVGGHTNAGAPSNNFAKVTEYAYSAAILSIDLAAIEAMPIKTDSNGQKYFYDLPTVDDPTRNNVNGINDPNTPGYNGVDPGDPFGGNDGLNQAKIVPGSPVQIYSPGYRNLYDIVLTENGRMYGVDNGANGGWGGHPYNEANYPTDANGFNATYTGNGGTSTTGICTNNFITGEPGSNSTGPGNDPQVNNKNGLHYIRPLVSGEANYYAADVPYYAGHPTPTRGNPAGAGLYTKGSHTEIAGQGDEFWRNQILPVTDPNFSKRSLPVDWFGLPATQDRPAIPAVVPSANPVECDFRNSGQHDNAIANYNPSTNGITEYTASNFNNGLKGDLLAAGYSGTGSVYHIILSDDGKTVTNCPTKGSGANSTFPDCNVTLVNTPGSNPLDVTALGDDEIFPGTIWAAVYGADTIYVFEPADYLGDNPPLCDGTDDAGLDEDGDGFNNADEIDNNTNPCSAGSTPTDNDDDKISDLNDPDDDNDTIADASDAFALDANNGTTTALPVNYELFNATGIGFGGVGFTGLMTNGTTNYLNQFNAGDVILGGTSGLATIPGITGGDSFGNTNTQQNAFQFGIDTDSSMVPFVVEAQINAPFFNSTLPIDFASMGIQIGAGNQGDYLKLVLSKGAGNAAVPGFQFLEETNNSTASGNTSFTVDVPELLNAAQNNFDPNLDAIRLFMEVNPANGEVKPYYALVKNGVVGPRVAMNTTATLAGNSLAALQGTYSINGIPSGFAVGMISTSTGPAPDFGGTWDYFYVTPFGAPVVQNPLPDLDVQVGSANANINISNVFVDDGGLSGLEFAASSSNTNVANVSVSGTTLTVDYGIVGSAIVTVTATDGNNNETSTTFNVSVSDEPEILYRVNSGGPTINAIDGGPNWIGETGAGSVAYYTGGGTYTNNGLDFALDIYNTERSGNVTSFSYNFPVDAGEYTVKLHFAEIYHGAPNTGGSGNGIGSRTFNVTVEGQSFLSNYDVFAEAGGAGIPVIETLQNIEVTDGNLTITLAQIVDQAKISGIEVLQVPDGGSVDPGVPIVLDPISDQLSIEGEEASFDVAANGGDGNKQYSISGQPAGISIEPTNGDIIGTISAGAANNSPYTVTVLVDDSDGTSSDAQSTTFLWTVLPDAEPGDAIYRVNAGGPQVAANDGGIPWSEDQADESNGGQANSAANPGTPSPYLNLTGATGQDVTFGANFTGTNSTTAPNALFNTERYNTFAGTANNMQWDFPVRDGEYTVNLYFAETWTGAQQAGIRVFDVQIEGALALDDFDIVETGGWNIVVLQSVPVSVNDGNLDINFIQNVQNPAIKAIEILAAESSGSTPTPTSTPVTPTPTPTTAPTVETVLYRINVGGPQLNAADGSQPVWAVDNAGAPSAFRTAGSNNIYSGGGNAHPGPIIISPEIQQEFPAVPADLFNTERFDTAAAPEMLWQFPVAAGTQVEVRLFFAELFLGTYQAATDDYTGIDKAGERVFDVELEGSIPASFDNIDPFAIAGPKGAVVRTAQVISDGTIDIEFIHVIENPALKGIEIVAISTTTPTPTVEATTETPTATPTAIAETPTETPTAIVETPTETPTVIVETPTETPTVIVETPTGTPETPTATPTTTTGEAVLLVEKTASDDFATVGDLVTYTIEVSNTGDATATNVVVTDTLPDGTSLINVTVTGNADDTCDTAITCTIPTLNADEIVTIEIEVEVVTVVTTYTATRTVQFNTSNYVLSEFIAPSVVFVSSVPGEPTCVYNTSTNFLTCNLGSATTGQQKSVDVSIIVPSEQPEEIINTVNVTADNATSVTDSATISIGEPLALDIEPETLDFTLAVGDSDSGVLTVTDNDGSLAEPTDLTITALDDATSNAPTWLSLTATGFDIDTTGLTAGDYSATITASATGYLSDSMIVTLTVTEQSITGDGMALLTINANGTLGASTYSSGSFVLSNTSASGTGIQITEMSIDLSTAILPDMVFDPTGTGGDATASCLNANSGGTATGLTIPGNGGSGSDPDCVMPFSAPRNGGFDVLTLNFTDFGPGETLVFTTDVDPNSIQGVPGAGNAGSVSGYELVGATITVTFTENGEEYTYTTSLFEDGSLGGGEAIVKEDTPAAPSISIEGVPNTPAVVNSTTQTVNITGEPGENVTILVMDARLYIATGAAPFGVTPAELPFYANEAMSGKGIYNVTLDGNGEGSVEITLFQTPGSGTTPDGGLNHIIAMVNNGTQNGLTSDPIVLKYDPNATEPSLTITPASINVTLQVGESTSVNFVVDSNDSSILPTPAAMSDEDNATGNDASWMGTTSAANQGVTYQLNISAVGLTAGTYTGKLIAGPVTGYTDAEIPVTLIVTNQPQGGFEGAICINAGGGALTTVADDFFPAGVQFLADTVNPSTYFNSNSKVFTNNSAVISNSSNVNLFKTERSATGNLVPFSFALGNLSAGEYTVNLYFADIYFGATGGGTRNPNDGQRVFDVIVEPGTANEVLFLDNYDINAEVGPQTVVQKSGVFTISDSTLNITFAASVDQAKISALCVIPQQSGVNTPPSIGPVNNTSVTAGETSTTTFSVSDLTQGDVVTVDVDVVVQGTNAPVTSNLVNNNNGTWTVNVPTVAADAGKVFVATITANDGTNPDVTKVFTITVNTPSVNNPAAIVTIKNGQNGYNDVSTFGANSLIVQNTGDVSIVGVNFNVSNTFMPDVIFDPLGSGGDTIGKCFNADSQTGDGVGLQTPSGGTPTNGTNPACVQPFSLPNDGGYFGLNLDFNDFEPGEQFGFSVDMDPSSIKGDNTPGGSGGISGLEMIPGTVTVEFSDGTVISAPVWLDATQSDAGGRAVIGLNAPTTAPSIVMQGLNTPTTTGIANQTVVVNGVPNGQFTLLQVDARMHIDSGSANGAYPNGFDIEPFEANESVNKVIYNGTLNGSGQATVPVTLLASPTPYGTGPVGGLNHFIAVIKGVNGQTSPASNVIVVNYNPAVGNNLAPQITNPGSQFSLAGQPIAPLQIVASDPDGAITNYAATNLPPGLSINLNTGAISGTPQTPPIEDGPFNEQNGIVIVEVESVPPTGDWSIQTDVSGASGQYYEWKANNTDTGITPAGQGILSYPIKINTPGDYRFMLRSWSGPGGDYNDVWVRIQGGSSTAYAVDPNPQDGIAPNGQDVDGTTMGKNWFKVYDSGSSWTFDAKHVDDDPHQVFINFPAAGQYTLELSGRSNQFLIDRWALFNAPNKQGTALSLNTPVSQRATINTFNYNVVVTAFDNGTPPIGAPVSFQWTISTTPITPTPTPTATAPASAAVTSFTLIDATTDQPIGIINNGAVLGLNTLPAGGVNIRADVGTSVAGVIFNLTGAVTQSKTENGAPFALFGDSNGNYAPWTPIIGSYTLVGTPTNNAAGALTIQFSIVQNVTPTPTGTAATATPTATNTQVTPTATPTGTSTTPTATATTPSGPAVTSFTLINAGTDLPIGVINNGGVLDINSLPAGVNIRADTVNGVTGVNFTLTGPVNETASEGTAPFALFGDSNGNYAPWAPVLGTYTLTGTPTNNAAGALTITFTIAQNVTPTPTSITETPTVTPTATSTQVTPTATPTSTTPTATATTPSGTCGGLVQEAENAQLTGAFQILNGTASGGQYIATTQGSGNFYVSPGPSKATFCFTVTEAGDYKITGLVKGVDSVSDSFWVQVNGGTAFDWYIPSGASFISDDVSDYPSNIASVFTLPAGQITVVISVREDAAQLDQLTLVKVGGPAVTPTATNTPGTPTATPTGTLPATTPTATATTPSGPAVTGFTLINAASDQPFGTLTNNAVLNINDLPAGINVRADTTSGVSGVNFTLSGAVSWTSGEGNAPYALFGDSNGNYAPWTPVLGSYTLTAAPANNPAGALTINFSIVAGGAATPTPTGTTAAPTATSTTSAPTPTATATTPSGGSCGPLTQQAESGTLSGAFVVVNDGAASSGQYIHVPNGTGNSTGAPSATSKAVFCFTVPQAGVYNLKGIGYASSGSNTFWVQVSGIAQNFQWVMPVQNSYNTYYLGGNNNPIDLNLPAGQVTVTVSLREDGTRLDTITLEPENAPPVANINILSFGSGAQRSAGFSLSAFGTTATGAADLGTINVPDRDGVPGELVSLDASGSFDPDGRIVSYLWTINGQTYSGIAVSVRLQDGANSVALVVVDDLGAESEAATLTLFVEAPQAGEEPTDEPTTAPTATPTDAPVEPTAVPTDAPVEPTATPTDEPTATTEPTATPTDEPTATTEPTSTPTDEPTATTEPTATPTELPSNNAPVAVVGQYGPVGDTDGVSGQEITLNGLTSTDSDGQIVSYTWQVNNQTYNGGEVKVKLNDGANNVTLTVVDNEGASDQDSTIVMVEAPASAAPAVLSLSLIDGDNTTFGILTDGAVLNMAQLAEINIRADATSRTGSVAFDLRGEQTLYQVRNTAPYSLFGANDIWENIEPGSYTLTVTAFSGDNAGGSRGNSVTLAFTVVHQSGGAALTPGALSTGGYAQVAPLTGDNNIPTFNLSGS